MTRVFYDFEFVELGPSAPLIPVSLGMVRSDGAELYLQFLKGLKPAEEHPWLSKFVVPHLEHLDCGHNLLAGITERPGLNHVLGDRTAGCPWIYIKTAAAVLKEFLLSKLDGRKLEMWGWYADYDHVLISQVFGRMLDLPEGVPMYTLDLRQEVWRQEVSHGKKFKVPFKPEKEHHSLYDARWNQRVFEWLYPEGLPELQA